MYHALGRTGKGFAAARAQPDRPSLQLARDQLRRHPVRALSLENAQSLPRVIQLFQEFNLRLYYAPPMKKLGLGL